MFWSSLAGLDKSWTCQRPAIKLVQTCWANRRVENISHSNGRCTPSNQPIRILKSLDSSAPAEYAHFYITAGASDLRVWSKICPVQPSRNCVDISRHPTSEQPIRPRREASIRLVVAQKKHPAGGAILVVAT
ncbi:MAG: hypothetical protein NC218_03240 [Acetobacter sp.]|nr:hypothetical protein [Acetobacter sp.]